MKCDSAGRSTGTASIVAFWLILTQLIISGCSPKTLPDEFYGLYAGGGLSLVLKSDGTFVYKGEGRNAGQYRITSSDGSSPYDWKFTIELDADNDKEIMSEMRIALNYASYTNRPVAQITSRYGGYWGLDKK